jgi:hypothetical protein
LLVLDNGIYYGFIPVGELGKPEGHGVCDASPSAKVELNVNYALVLHTNAGLWGYEIGDTVKFVSLKPPRIKVTGRTKHFTSAFGEHVIAEEVEGALEGCHGPRSLVRWPSSPWPRSFRPAERPALPRVVHRIRRTTGRPGPFRAPSTRRCNGATPTTRT